MPEATVREENCKTRQASLWRVITALITLFGIAMMVGGWLGWLTLITYGKAAAAQATVDTYIAKDEERSIAIAKSLDQIQNLQIRMSIRLDNALNQKPK